MYMNAPQLIRCLKTSWHGMPHVETYRGSGQAGVESSYALLATDEQGLFTNTQYLSMAHAQVDIHLGIARPLSDA